MTSEHPVLAPADAAAWSDWLDVHADRSSGVWLVLAKKGVAEPTSLTYDQALEEAICHGWVDGQLARGDERTYRRRFTPRRSASAWSERNVALARRLTDEGRMRPAGLAVVRRAQADGTWGSAYAGSATIQVPADLAAALEANPAARAMFERLSSANRYAVLYRVTTAKREETRRSRIERFVSMLARGETLHPHPETGHRAPGAGPGRSRAGPGRAVGSRQHPPWMTNAPGPRGAR